MIEHIEQGVFIWSPESVDLDAFIAEIEALPDPYRRLEAWAVEYNLGDWYVVPGQQASRALHAVGTPKAMNEYICKLAAMAPRLVAAYKALKAGQG